MNHKARLLILAGLLAIGLVLSGCSTYKVIHTETATDGTVYSTAIEESVPPGGRKLSEGMADIGVNVDGSWHLKLGSTTDTDAAGTADLIRGVVRDSIASAIAASAASKGIPITDLATSPTTPAEVPIVTVE